MENTKDNILDSYMNCLNQLSRHHYKNRSLLRKMMNLNMKMKKECEEPEIEVFNKFLNEMKKSKKLYEKYFHNLVIFYEHFFKKYKIGRKFIRELFEYSDDENDSEKKKIIYNKLQKIKKSNKK